MNHVCLKNYTRMVMRRPNRVKALRDENEKSAATTTALALLEFNFGGRLFLWQF